MRHAWSSELSSRISREPRTTHRTARPNGHAPRRGSALAGVSTRAFPEHCHQGLRPVQLAARCCSLPLAARCRSLLAALLTAQRFDPVATPPSRVKLRAQPAKPKAKRKAYRAERYMDDDEALAVR